LCRWDRLFKKDIVANGLLHVQLHLNEARKSHPIDAGVRPDLHVECC